MKDGPGTSGIPQHPPSVTGVFGVNFPPLNPQLLCLEFGKIWSDFCHVRAMGVVELSGWQCGEGSGEGGKMGNQGEGRAGYQHNL